MPEFTLSPYHTDTFFTNFLKELMKLIKITFDSSILPLKVLTVPRVKIFSAEYKKLQKCKSDNLNFKSRYN